MTREAAKPTISLWELIRASYLVSRTATTPSHNLSTHLWINVRSHILVVQTFRCRALKDGLPANGIFPHRPPVPCAKANGRVASPNWVNNWVEPSSSWGRQILSRPRRGAEGCSVGHGRGVVEGDRNRRTPVMVLCDFGLGTRLRSAGWG